MVLYKWFTETSSKGKHVTGPMTEGGDLFLYSPSIEAQQKITCKQLGQYQYYMVIQHLSSPLDARLRGFLK